MEVRGWDDRKLANASAFAVPVFASVTVVSANRGALKHAAKSQGLPQKANLEHSVI